MTRYDSPNSPVLSASTGPDILEQVPIRADPGLDADAAARSAQGAPVADTAGPMADGLAALGDGLATALPGADSGAAWLGPLQAPAQTIMDLLALGGPVMLVLAILSVLALAIVLIKLWQFAVLRPGARQPVAHALALWRANRAREALDAVSGSRQPAARLVGLAMAGLLRPDLDQELLREELARFASQELERMRAWLRALDVIGGLSPLLGLLGTVLGMVEAFRRLEQAGARVDPTILSGGIWQALLTTAAGLSVAIPVVMVHAWLERRVERAGAQMEDAVTQVFTRTLADVVVQEDGDPRRPSMLETRHAA